MTDDLQKPDSEVEPNSVEGLRSDVQELSEGITNLVRRSKRDRVVVFIAYIALFLSTGGIVHASVNSCDAGNNFRIGQNQLWDHFLSVAAQNPGQTPAQLQQIAEAKVYVHQLFVLRDCSLYHVLKP